MEGDEKIWKRIIDTKYSSNRRAKNFVPNSNPNISRFWKGVKSTIQALKMGYRWSVGNGSRIRFWEDTWFGNSPLSVQFCPFYVVCNEQNICLADAWNGTNLKL